MISRGWRLKNLKISTAQRKASGLDQKAYFYSTRRAIARAKGYPRKAVLRQPPFCATQKGYRKTQERSRDLKKIASLCGVDFTQLLEKTISDQPRVREALAAPALLLQALLAFDSELISFSSKFTEQFLKINPRFLCVIPPLEHRPTIQPNAPSYC